MKLIAAIASVALASTAYADSTIRLRGGESVTLSPSVETTVICEATAPQILEKFCVCEDFGSSHMKNLNKHYVYTNGEKTTIELGRYQTMDACNAAKAATDACK